MTPTQRREAIIILGFESVRSFARFMRFASGWDEREVRRWFERPTPQAPRQVDAWLDRRRAAMLADGPPAPAPTTRTPHPLEEVEHA